MVIKPPCGATKIGQEEVSESGLFNFRHNKTESILLSQGSTVLGN